MSVAPCLWSLLGAIAETMRCSSKYVIGTLDCKSNTVPVGATSGALKIIKNSCIVQRTAMESICDWGNLRMSADMEFMHRYWHAVTASTSDAQHRTTVVMSKAWYGATLSTKSLTDTGFENVITSSTTALVSARIDTARALLSIML